MLIKFNEYRLEPDKTLATKQPEGKKKGQTMFDCCT